MLMSKGKVIMRDISNELLEIMERYKCNEVIAFLILIQSEKV